MQALQRNNRMLFHRLWQDAIGGCLAVDEFSRTRDPALLQQIQEDLARAIIRVEGRLQDLYKRRRNRGARMKPRLLRKPELRSSVRDHQRLLKERDELLQRERSLLRQVGDAIAWQVLRADPSVIAPLWADGRTHFLPPGIGTAAPIEVLKDLNASGDLLAIWNDLTRCVAVGDVTVVPRSGPWIAPMLMELKASRPDGDDEALAEIDVLSPRSKEPTFLELYDRVCSVLGSEDRVGGRLDIRAQRQVGELMERTGLALRLQARLTVRLQAPASNHWPSVGAVLERAYAVGESFDFPEGGVAYFAVRTQPSDDPGPKLERVIDRVARMQPQDSLEIAVSTLDLTEHDRLSVLVPPIATWRISGDLRNALLSGRLFFGVTVTETAWADAFDGEDLTRHVRDGAWQLSHDGEPVVLDRFEVQKIQLGTALAGLSPSAVARSVREALT